MKEFSSHVKIKTLKNGVPCSPGCLSHISHPCEKCGRVAGSNHIMNELFTLREQLEFVTGELTAAKLVIEAAELWDTASKWDGKGSIENAAVDIGVAARVLKENLKEYGSQFPGEEK